jgi:hypothetical protein
LAQNAGIENPWLAWIPVVNLYILGRLIRTLKISTYEVPSPELVLPLGWLVMTILGRVAVLGTLAWLVYIILLIFALHKLYSMYRPTDATLWLVLSIVFFFMAPIFIFVIRNDKQVNSDLKL